VASNQIGLELIDLIAGNPDVGKLTKPGVDAIDRPAGLDGLLDYTAALRQGTAGPGLDGNPTGGISGHSDHVLDRERVAVKNAV
jgi:hypothetical protein